MGEDYLFLFIFAICDKWYFKSEKQHSYCHVLVWFVADHCHFWKALVDTEFCALCHIIDTNHSASKLWLSLQIKVQSCMYRRVSENSLSKFLRVTGCGGKEIKWIAKGRLPLLTHTYFTIPDKTKIRKSQLKCLLSKEGKLNLKYIYIIYNLSASVISWVRSSQVHPITLD